MLLAQFERKGNSVAVRKQQVDGHTVVVLLPHQFACLFSPCGAIDFDRRRIESLPQRFEFSRVRGAQ